MTFSQIRAVSILRLSPGKYSPLKITIAWKKQREQNSRFS